jgi:RNA polymerase sigma factor (sigma-70 family)
MFAMEDLADDILQESVPVSGLITRSHPELENDTDDGLVTYMAFQTTDEEMALKACEQLHSRHARFMLGWCIKNRNETFGESAEDFVNKTFFKAFTEADKFVCPDSADGTNQVLAWLFRIMKNLYLDSRRAEGRRPVARPNGEAAWLEEIEERQRESAEQVPTGTTAAMRAFLKTLSPKDKEILTSTAEFWDPKKGEAVIDDDVREGICAEYGLTESSLRVRRKRLKDRAKAFIQQNTK